MRKPATLLSAAAGLLALILAGCAALAPAAPLPTPCPPDPAAVVCAPESDPSASPAAPQQATLPAQAGPAGPAASLPTQTPSTPRSPSATPAPTACPPEQFLTPPCSRAVAFPFERPVGDQDNQRVDPTYRFAMTQNSQRDPHHGVELLNGAGTPVLAAAEGVVIVAGDDKKTLYSPYPNYYGSLVILEHRFPAIAAPVYSLYAHLSRIDVKAGERLTAGQVIGAVGMSGSATGSHLHFEVRYGENTYAAARNPELWLRPLPDAQGVTGGALAGIIRSEGQRLFVPQITVDRLAGPDGPVLETFYLSTYEDKTLAEQPPFGETFALGDLPPGWYQITFIQFGMQIRRVEVLPGEIAWAEFDLQP